MADKQEIEKIKNQLIKMTSEFCLANIDSEYEQLCRKMIEKMARKKSVPFLSGRIEIWAASIVYSIGMVNFLFDKSFKPYVTADQICDHFSVAKSTVGQKAKMIREDMFKMDYWVNEFSTQRMIKENPFSNLAIVDGFIVRI